MESVKNSQRGALAKSLYVNKWLKRYARWRMLAIFLLVVIIGYTCNALWSKSPKSEYIVKLAIKDEIMDMAQVRKAYKLLDDPMVKGVLVLANSPGGLPAVSEAWGTLFSRLQKKNIPVVVITEDVCASGCYLAIMGANKIFSYNSSIIGSIGAVMGYPNVYNILKKLDIDYNVLKSGPLKAEPNIFSQQDPIYAEESQQLVSDIGTWFVQKVVNARQLADQDAIKTIQQGGIYTAKRALSLALIDAIADELTAMDYIREILNNPTLPFETFELSETSWIQNILQRYGIMAQIHGKMPSITLSR